MRNPSLVVPLLFATFAVGALAQSPAKPEPWLSSKKLAEGVWVISDHGSDNMYLVEGKTRALLIDTGLGVARLGTFLKTLTSKPIVVVNTHGHPDHSGGNFEFKTVYGHPADFEAMKSFNTVEARKRTAQNMAKGAAGPDIIPIEEAANASQPELLPVKDGHIFDLGGRKIEVIEAPGHTPGEIVLLDAANKLLFTGDNTNTLVWLFLPNSLPLEAYLQTLKKLERRSAEYATVFPGHGTPLPPAFISEQVACVTSILDGTAKSEPQKYFAGEAMVAKYKTASVAYNPANLRVKK